MLFHSQVFIIFFIPIIFLLYFSLNLFKNFNSHFVLILGGFIFYSWWNIYLAPLIVASILFNFYFSHLLIGSNNKDQKKTILFFSIMFNICFLAFFKYLDFTIQNINFIFDSNIVLLGLPFPLALSFVTFQTIAYLVDCYDGNIKKINFTKFSLFIIFFPQLIAGPIVKYNEMMPQFISKKNKIINHKNILIGLAVFCVGYIKKIYIADNLSLIADFGFANSFDLTFFSSWLTSLSFTFQIYFDFSGYIDMATGVALLFNIRLPKNFDSPYLSTSLINFWQRWHITLSSFLMNYIYFPWLKSMKSINFFKSMMITLFVFLIAGIWHGPTWLYVIFGALHGFGLIVNHTFNKFFEFKFNKYLGWFITFNYVNLTLIFFRSQEISAPINILKGMLGLKGFEKFIFDVENLFIIAIFIVVIITTFILPNINNLIDEYFKKNKIIN